MKNKQLTKGFTLLETLASVAIMVIMIIGPLTVITESSSYSRQTKDSIIATYLAEELIELIENQYDSIYLLCKKQPENAYCAPNVGETNGQTSWRLFKEKFAAGDGQPSCYGERDNEGAGGNNVPQGCTFDYEQMTGDITVTPSRSPANNENCRTVTEYLFPDGTVKFLCTGSAHSNGAIPSTKKTFSRSVYLEHNPTYDIGNMLSQYNDDIKIISEVKHKGVNGVTYTSRVSRFIHAQP